MAQKSGFFNATKVGTTYDRTYYAEDFAEMIQNIVGTGVLDTDNDDLTCHAQSSPNLTLYVSAGRAYINGYWYVNTTDYTLTLAPTSASQARIDAVAVRLNLTTREINLALVAGTASANPVAPTPTRNDTTYELFIAYVNMPKNATEVQASYIEDKRSDTTVCGKLANQYTVVPLSDSEIDNILK